MNRYDDPRWYEEDPGAQAHEEHAAQVPPTQPEQHDFIPFAFPSDEELQQQQQGQYPSHAQSNTKAHRFQQSFRRFLVIAAFVVVAFWIGWFSHQLFANSYHPGSDSQTYLNLFEQAWSTVDQNYVDRNAINYQKMTYAAIDAMVKSLGDTNHSRFMTPAEVQAEHQQLSGKFTGIGIYLRQDQQTKQLIINAPIPGSPAEKAGLKHGDVIVAVNGTNVVGKDTTAVSNLIQGTAGTQVTITVQRAGQNMTFHVMRAEIQVPNVIMHYISEDHIADIQIVQFSDGISSQLRAAVNEAKREGATRIILDLRDNPGGYLNEAVDTASVFVKSGNVLLERDSSGQNTPVAVNGNTLDTTSQMVVLVNQNSASAAEIVTGALHDNHRATIIGVKTFGTGTVLQQFNLADGSALLVGTQEWLRPTGANFRQGILPDFTITMPTNAAQLSPNDENAGHMTEQQILNSGDAQLSEAIHYLTGQIK